MRESILCLQQSLPTRLGFVLFVFVTALAVTTSFRPTPRFFNHNHRGQQWPHGAGSPTSTAKRMAAIDPSDLVNGAASVHHHFNNHAVDTSTWDTLLSTLYTTTVEGVVKPAHGHSQPLFGPTDPYLTSGKSIAPNLKAILDTGVSSEVTSPTIAVDQLPEEVRAFVPKGIKVYDASKMDSFGGIVLPGFSPTRGILTQHLPEPDAATMGKSLESLAFNRARFYPALEKLPMAAFVYVLIDFFLLRPGVDLYKEDMEEDPVDITLETVAVTGVRLAVFAVLGLITLTLFSL